MDNKDFKPYIPAEKITPEITITSIVMGVLLAVIFGAANAYLGLRVGMTVSASIPAAVIAMGVIRVIMRKNSILESNIVQTIGSAGESLAAGAIFTLPALFLWAAEGKVDKPGLWEITAIALIGGLLGVFFMVPLRNALIVKEHGVLPYPEGTACSEVLLAGEEGGAKASTVFAGMGFAALFKFIIDGLKLVAGEISVSVKGFAGQIGTQIYPAVMSVGYICGARISSYMFAGGILSWLVIIPLIVLFGADMTLYPGTAPISEIFAKGGAGAIWGTYIRYIGAGALAAGGIISLIKSLPLILKTFGGAVKSMAGSKEKANERTSKDISIKVVFLAIVVLTLLVWLIPAIPVSLLGAVIIVVFGFFFATVSSRMVGLVGSSNNPVSGMAIATLLIATLILKVSGATGIARYVQRDCDWLGYLHCFRHCRRYVSGSEDRVPFRRHTEETADWRNCRRYCRGTGNRRNTLSPGQRVGLWYRRTRSASGHPDEADYRRGYGRKSSVGAGVYRGVYCCVGRDCRHTSAALCDWRISSCSAECVHYGWRSCPPGFG